MKIPDKLWRCPKCGDGYRNGDGLTYDEFDEAENDEYDPDGECSCSCGWTGTAIKRSRRRPCPHCGGTGWTEEDKPGA